MHCFLCGARLSGTSLLGEGGRRHQYLPAILAPSCYVCGVLAGVADFRRVRKRLAELSRFGLGGPYEHLLARATTDRARDPVL